MKRFFTGVGIFAALGFFVFNIDGATAAQCGGGDSTAGTSGATRSNNESSLEIQSTFQSVASGTAMSATIEDRMNELKSRF